MTSTKIIFNNIADKWEDATSASSKNIIVFSPYATSPIAEKVLQYTPECQCEFYTQFHAEIFINRSSSLLALKKILNNGFKTYYLSNLHAKIVLVDNNFATIGSQNLTYNGTCNKESNTLFKDVNIISKIKYEIEKWIKDRCEITIEMIEEMENLIEPFLKQYEIILNKLVEPEKEILLRQEERNKKAELFALKEKINEALISNQIIRTRVVGIEKYSYSSDEYYTTYSLMPIDSSENLTNWNIKGVNHRLTKSFRHICLNLTTGKFGWARIFKTRITFFASGVNMTTPLLLNNIKCNIAFDALWDDNKKNIKITLKPLYSTSEIILYGKFDLFYLTEVEIEKKNAKI